MAGFLRIDVNAADWKSRMDRYRFKKFPYLRRQFIRAVMAVMLDITTVNNPIETGRSRVSWVQSVSRLGYPEPKFWKAGARPRLYNWVYYQLARSEGRRKSRLVWREGRHQTELQATSMVEYVVFLEYGTEYFNAFRMVRDGFETLWKAPYFPKFNP